MLVDNEEDIIFSDMLSLLNERSNKISDIKIWLFVVVNTARALIDSTNKDDLNKLVFDECCSVIEIQQNFDIIQGKYGKKFSSRKNPTYNYLCSIIAVFPDKTLTDDERTLIVQYNRVNEYLLYEL